jgi:predicted ATP-grasp superfamily ATP-dependent carboligase
MSNGPSEDMKATDLKYRPAAVILNMHYTGLGIARTLRDAGTAVWGLSFNDGFIGNRSRDCRFMRYPDPAADPEAALAFLVDFARRFDGPPVLFPTRDLDLRFLLACRSVIELQYLLPLPSSAVMERILDKSELFAAAQAVGISCPREVRVSAREDLERARREIGLPCIVKPVVASRWRHGEAYTAVRGRKVVVFDRWEELTHFYERVARADPEMLVQELIPGSDEELVIFGSYVNAASGLVRYFTARKLLQAPPGSGTGIVVQALPVPEIVDDSLALLKTLAYTGISEIEYKRDARTGRHALIEINPRHWDQHALGAAAGVNLTRALYADLIGERVPEMGQDPRPMCWIAEEGYLLGLQDAVRGTGYPLRQYLRPLWGRKTWATFSWRDPLPTLRLLRRVAQEYLRNLRNFVARLIARPIASRSP